MSAGFGIGSAPPGGEGECEEAKAGRRVVVGTGLTRGIGLELARLLAPHVTLLSLQRGTDAPVEGVETLGWDLAASPSAERHEALEKALAGRAVWGFLHCAGVLGPVGAPVAEPLQLLRYSREFESALRVNCTSAVELCEALLPSLRAGGPGEARERPPFVLHLSSGAALNPYAGWDSYCVTKAACRMHFRQLAHRFPVHGPVVLSIAPGTVMTDMMRSVLASPEEAFPDVKKFRALEKAGGLVNPSVPAGVISRLLLESPLEEFRALHGVFYDLRKGVVAGA